MYRGKIQHLSTIYKINKHPCFCPMDEKIPPLARPEAGLRSQCTERAHSMINPLSLSDERIF